MRAKTDVDPLSHTDSNFRISRLQDLLWFLRSRVDAILALFGLVTERHRQLASIEAAAELEGDAPRLSDAELERMIEFQVLAEDIEYRRRYFAENRLERTLPGQFVELVDALIRQDQSIRSVLDIGVRYAYPDSVLAARHPDVKFIGVDFMPNLKEFNAEFACPNLRFVHGYALDLLERGDLGADVAVFSATAIAIRNAELRRYLRALSCRSRYVVFNELLYPLPGGRYIDPRSLPASRSVATFVQPVPWKGYSGPICKAHNSGESH